MATSGAFENAFRNGYKLRVEWIVNSQSIENNTSNLTVTAFLISTSSSHYITSRAEKTIELVIDGTTYTKTEGGLANLSGGQKKQVFSKSVTIQHTDDGTKSVAISCAFNLDVTLSGIHWYWVYAPASGSATAVLDTISRPTTPTLTSTNLTMGKAVTVSLPRKSSTFTHVLKITFGGKTRTVASDVTTSYSWTPETETFAPDIPNAASGSGTLTCHTYQNGKLIGSKGVNVTLNVPTTVIPTFGTTPISAEETVTGIASKFGGFVQNVSSLLVNVSANGIYGSTITTYKVTLDGLAYNSGSFTSEKITSSGTLTISATVTDSRGRSNTSSLNINVLPYEKPNIISITSFRCNADGEEYSEGTRTNTMFSFSISEVNNLNDKQYKIVYRKTGAEDWTTLTTGSLYSANTNYISNEVFEADSTYDVGLEVSDYIYTIIATTEVPNTFSLIDLRNTGKGIEFGSVSNEDCFGVSMEAKFRKNASVEGNFYASNIKFGSGTITPVANTPTRLQIVFDEPFPDGVTPKIFITGKTTSPGVQLLGIAINNPSSTGFYVWVTRINTIETTFDWLAIG